MTDTESKLTRQRERKADEAGENSYFKKSDGKWYFVEATFYPKTKLWISDPKRREITKEELARDFETLKL